MKFITSTSTVPESHRRGLAPGPGRIQSAGFTFVELLLVLVVLALLLAVVLPALAHTKPRVQRVNCVSNLARVGEAFNTWAGDHGERYSMQVNYADGGPREHPSGLQNNPYFQFAWISNQLVTPRILVCPSDGSRRTASNWGFGASGGFLHPNFQNLALSYILAHPFPENGRGVLSGDRNISPGTVVGGCSYFVPALAGANGWGNSIHAATGNLLFNDGSVEQTDDAALRRSTSLPTATNPGIHFIAP